MALAHAMWTHGHSMVIEYPASLTATWRAGFFIRVEGKKGTGNWFHFAIPTPVIVDNNRLTVGSVMLRFRTASNDAFIHAVHVYDGETKIASHDNLHLAPNQWAFERFDVPPHPEVLWGLGISIGVQFNANQRAKNQIEINSAGCDFLP